MAKTVVEKLRQAGVDRFDLRIHSTVEYPKRLRNARNPDRPVRRERATDDVTPESTLLARLASSATTLHLLIQVELPERTSYNAEAKLPE